MDNSFRENLLKNLLLIGGLSSFVNLPILYQISFIFANMVLGFSIIYLILFFLFKKEKLSYDKTSNIALLILFIQTLNIPIHTGIDTFLLPWMLLYPVVVFSLKPNSYGIKFSTLLFAIFIGIFFFSFCDDSYQIMHIVTFGMLYFTVLLVFYYINKNTIDKEDSLKNQKELYDLVFENSTNGVLLIDATTGKFSDCNNSIVSMLKYTSKDDILNLHPSELSPLTQPDTQKSDKKANEMIEYAMKHGTHTFEWKHVKATGEEFWAEITLTPIIIQKKSFLHVVWKDIDEQKQSRIDLEIMNNTLEGSIKIATHSLEAKNKALQESIDNFQNLLDTTMEAIVLSDEHSKIIDINQSGITMLGYDKKSEIIGSKVSNHVLESELPKLQKAMRHDIVLPY